MLKLYYLPLVTSCSAQSLHFETFTRCFRYRVRKQKCHYDVTLHFDSFTSKANRTAW